jgi:DNA-binding MarR family transcriptional regulator
VQQGFVERRETPEDRRSKQISLTALGEKTVKECRESRELWLSELAARLNAEEAELTIGALKILSAKMSALDEAVPDPFGAAKKESRQR